MNVYKRLIHIAVKMKEKIHAKNLKTANFRHLMIINDLSQNFKKWQGILNLNEKNNSLQIKIYLINLMNKFITTINSFIYSSFLLKFSHFFLNIIFFDLDLRISHILEGIPIIDPGHKLKLSWDCFMMLMIMLLLFAYPIQLCFNIKTFIIDKFFENDELILNFFEIFIIVLLASDILLKMNTAYYEAGRLINRRNEILKNYVKTDFIRDILVFISIFVSNYVPSHYKENVAMNNFFKYFQILIFLKIFEVLKLVHLLEEVSKLSNKGTAVFQLLKLAFGLFLYCHLMACIWHAVAYYGPYSENFLISSNVFYSPWKTRYFRCLFCTVNPGKIDPKNDLELIFGFFALLATSGSIGFMISGIHNIMRTLSKSEETKRYIC